MLELVSTHDAEQELLEAEASEWRRRGVTFRELAADWLVCLEHEKGAKPSTLRDCRWLLAEPGQPHGRGTGTSPGLLMASFGDRPVRAITAREVSEHLRRLDASGASARTVNKHRQVILAMFNSGMREDALGLTHNPARATTKRREPPAAVLDFYEPDEVEWLAWAATRGLHRHVTHRVIEPPEAAARAADDAQDAERYRIAAYTGLRLGELLALRWEDVHLNHRRLVVNGHSAIAPRVRPRVGRRASSRSPIRPPRPSPGFLAASTSPLPATTCSATGSAVRSMARRFAADSSGRPRQPACAYCAFTHSGTALAPSPHGRPTRDGFRASSGTRRSQRPSATCTPRHARGPRSPQPRLPRSK